MSNQFRKMFWGSSFVKTPLANGLGRYVPQLQRITLKFCKESGGSLGMRSYIESNLLEFAKENPGTVVYVKPRRHRSSCLKAEYLNGGEEYISTHNHSKEDIIKWMELLRTKSGYPSKLLLKEQHTDFPSVQGPWTPFVHKDPSINIAEFPNENLSEIRDPRPSGTEELLRIFKQQKNMRIEEKEES